MRSVSTWSDRPAESIPPEGFLVELGQGRADRYGGKPMGPFSCRWKMNFALLAVLAFNFFSSSDVFATDIVFGPVTCQRGTGAPTVFNYSFAVPEPSRGFIFKVYNGGLDDTIYELVSSSVVVLNGAQILGPNNFNQKVAFLEVPVNLQAQNSLRVEVRGKPGGALVIKAFPFVVIDVPVSGLAISATSVSVSGHLYSEAIGIDINGVPGTVTDTTFAVSGIPLVEGGNVLTVTAAKTGGFTGQASVTVIRDTTPPVITLASPQDGATVSAPSVDITGSVSDPTAAVLVNGIVVALTGTSFAANGISLQVGLNTIPIEARDPLGNRAAMILHVTYAPPAPTATVTIESPTFGAVVAQDEITVSGSVRVSTPEVGLKVNGVLAQVNGDSWVANRVPLSTGENTLTAIAVDENGEVTETSATVTRTASPAGGIRLFSNVESGIAPLKVSFYLENDAGQTLVSYKMDFDGDGVVDLEAAAFEGVGHTYAAEGIFSATMVASDATGNQYVAKLMVNVHSLPPLKAKWDAMKAALISNDLQQALKYFSPASAEEYGAIFSSLGINLPEIATGMQEIELVYVQGDRAKYRFRRVESSQGVPTEFTYYIYFVRDADGFWKIRDF